MMIGVLIITGLGLLMFIPFVMMLLEKRERR